MPLTTEMVLVMMVLTFTIVLFITEVVRVDVAAMLAMVAVGTLGLVPAEELFRGFSSNAVVSIIAVMIIGAGLDSAGVMAKVAHFILKIGGKSERSILPIILGSVATISSFMQNVGTVALFLPVVKKISEQTQIPLSRLLMPMGFCALLGGTLTLVGCSALIILNDLILEANKILPVGSTPMQPFSLFDTTPIGIALVITGITYFLLFGRWVLPKMRIPTLRSMTPVAYFLNTYRKQGEIFEIQVTSYSPFVGKMIADCEQQANQTLIIIALLKGKSLRVSPAADVILEAGDVLAVISQCAVIESVTQQFNLLLKPQIETFYELLVPARSGIVKIVIPPDSQLIGQSLLEARIRKTFGLTILEIIRQGQISRTGLRDWVLESGDTLLVHSTWEDLTALENNKNFVTVNSDYPRIRLPYQDHRPDKMWYALGFFILSLYLMLFTELRLGIALLIGALGMVITNVITIEEGYKRVSWQTVFLLAGLIPVGNAMQATGTATWVAHQLLDLLGTTPTWVMQTMLATLATCLTLVMSNVGTTVLLVPLAVNIAVQTGADPAVFALTVALGTSNSFFLPTHQANALIMGTAGYRVTDYMRAGGIMSLLYLIVLITLLNIVF